MNAIHAALIGIAGLLGGDGRAVDFTGAGWYCAELSNEMRMTLKVLESRDGSFVCLYQGASLLLAKDRLKSLKRLGESAEDRRPGSLITPAQEERIRDAIEDLGSTDDGLVHRAYASLGGEFEAGREVLHEALMHRSTRTRRLVVKLLGENGESVRDTARITPLLGDTDEKVRLAAVMALRRLGSGAAESLLNYLHREQVANNRKMAVETLRLWKDAQAVESLIDMLAIERDHGVRVFMARALKTLTGRDLGDDHQAWRKYLQELGGRERVMGPGPGIEKKSDKS